MKHFASLGAKHIFTLSRSGPDSPIMRELVEEMRLAGVCVVVFKGSVTDTVAIESIKEQAREFPIRGVVQGAMVLQVRAQPVFHNSGDFLMGNRTLAWTI